MFVRNPAATQKKKKKKKSAKRTKVKRKIEELDGITSFKPLKKKKSGPHRQSKGDPSVEDNTNINSHRDETPGQHRKDVLPRNQGNFDNLPWQDIGPSFADLSSLSNLESGTSVPEAAYKSRSGLMTSTWEYSGFYGLEVLPGSAIQINESSPKVAAEKGGTKTSNDSRQSQEEKLVAASANTGGARRPANIPKNAWRKMTPAVRKAVSEAVSIARQEGVTEGKHTSKKGSKSVDETPIEPENVEIKQKRAKKKQERKKKKQQRKKALAAAEAAKSKKEKPEISEIKLRDTFPEWMGLDLPLILVRNIASNGFKTPTPIQKLSIPLVNRQRRHVIGAAPTGSGKTLAFGLPVLASLISTIEKQQKDESVNHGPSALILTPTRELGLQIKKHLDAVSKGTQVVTVCIVGGLARQKQERLLNRKPHMLVATPGRLWEFVAEGHPWLSSLHTSVTHLVLDEADRMADPGSFADLDQIFQRIFQPLRMVIPADSVVAPEGTGSVAKEKSKVQILLFSATLNIGDRGRDDKWTRKAGSNWKPQQISKKKKKDTPWIHGWKQGSFPNYPGVDSLLTLLGGKGLAMQERPAVIVIDAGETKKQDEGEDDDADDSTPSSTVVKNKSDVNNVALPDTLELYQISCADEEKDAYLLYFIKSFKHGRTLVFVNAIVVLKELVSKLQSLGVKAHPLHAKLQQRQRLKNLDRFGACKDNKQTSVLVCTDVAARGIDLPEVDRVVHFHMPQTPEIFVHRSGRTGDGQIEHILGYMYGPNSCWMMFLIAHISRAMKTGSCLALVAPRDQKLYANICQVLGREEGFPGFPIDMMHIRNFHKCASMAHRLVKEERSSAKKTSEGDWFRRMAEEADICLDEEVEEHFGLGKHRDLEAVNDKKRRMKNLRRQLKAMLSTLIFDR